MYLEIKNVSKRYGDQQALIDISFSLKKGDIVGFLGPNGAGKTTLMKIITSILKQDSGPDRRRGHGADSHRRVRLQARAHGGQGAEQGERAAGSRPDGHPRGDARALVLPNAEPLSDNLSAPHRRARRAGPRDGKASHEPQELSSEARVTGGGHRPVGAPRRVPDEPLLGQLR